MTDFLNSILGGGRDAGTGAGGGLGDLLGGAGLDTIVGQVTKGGLGDLVGSWVGKGENLPISTAQIESVLGSPMIASVAEKLGVSPHEAAERLSSLLPQVIDHLTPNGKLPEGGLDSVVGGLGGLLDGFLKS